MHETDFLIIGQGLAGSLLAYSLIKRGQRVLVLDKQHQGCSTQVAAGLINPITGHRLSLSNRFFDFSTQAEQLYWSIERDLGCAIYKNIQQTRLITKQSQVEYLKKRQQQTAYKPLLNDLHNNDGWFSDSDKYLFGGINISKTAIVDTKVLLYCVHNWLLQRESIKHHNVRYECLLTDSKRISYRADELTIAANNVVFCEGHQAIKNPWLKDLPFKLAKGDIATITTEQSVKRMLSWGHWLVPLSNGKAKLGSNYRWNDLSLEPSESAAKEFVSSLNKHTGIKASIKLIETGIRPTTTQRQQFVGPLKNFKNAYCLNGLGSKGCLIAPYYVNSLCDHMLNGTSLEKEVTQWI